MQERATAMKILSEGARNLAEARKIAAETAEIAARLDAHAPEVSPIAAEMLSPGELQRDLVSELAMLEEKLKAARLLYGTRVLQISEKAGPDTE